MLTALRRKLLWLLAARTVVVTLLLGSGALIQSNAPETLPIAPDAFFAVIGLTYGLTVAYALLLEQTERHRWLVDVQLALRRGDRLDDRLPDRRDQQLLLVALHAADHRGDDHRIAAGRRDDRHPQLRAVRRDRRQRSTPACRGSSRCAASRCRRRSWRSSPSPSISSGSGRSPALTGYLAEGLRQADLQLQRASDQIEDLQALSRHIIDSLTSGLATTDIRRAGSSRSTAPRRRSPGSRPSGRSARRRSTCCSCRRSSARCSASATSGPGCRAWTSRSGAPTGAGSTSGVSAALLLTPRGEAGFLLTFQDVTEARRLEREARVQQRLAAVGEMAAGIAHEIRNPLASMAGSIQILRQEVELTAEQSQLMDIVLRESERLNETIRSFLAYARPQRQALARVDVRRVITDTATLLENSPELRRRPPHRGGGAARRGVAPGRRRTAAADRLEPGHQRSARDARRRPPDARRPRRSGRRRRRRGVARGARRGDRHPVGGARRDLPAVPRRLRPRHRPRPVDRAADRGRLRRRDPGDLRPRRGHARAWCGCRRPATDTGPPQLRRRCHDDRPRLGHGAARTSRRPPRWRASWSWTTSRGSA